MALSKIIQLWDNVNEMKDYLNLRRFTCLKEVSISVQADALDTVSFRSGCLLVENATMHGSNYWLDLNIAFLGSISTSCAP